MGTNENYVTKQLEAVMLDGEVMAKDFKLQLHSNTGKTNVMNISLETMYRIYTALREEANRADMREAQDAI